AIVRTKGNPHCHIVLRGGHTGPNYDASHVAHCEKQLKHAGLPTNIMIDCSHANSHKQPENQLAVIHDIAQQIEAGNHSIKSIMVESNLNAGNQCIPDNLDDLAYGVSVTDGCIDWESTAGALRDLHTRLKRVR
ncbi:MAG TPA: 3-deoxy-7-phosphoheptulonate synthase, partial [Candidatus Tenderia sp.]|nr:3-deoxy-7-phosphoheptulonate synthase [Candidatus Tenderia sp.]